jgi:hypothetical protein
MNRRQALALAGLLMLAAEVAPAQAPRVINYQGLLTDRETGQPLSGTFDLTLSLYPGGDCSPDPAIPPRWSETHVGVILNNGLFDLKLGSVTPFPRDLFFTGEYCLGVMVGGEEILPRQPLGSVAYALSAEDCSPPRLTSAERDALAAPAQGLLIYNTDTKLLNFYDGAGWCEVPAQPVSPPPPPCTDPYEPNDTPLTAWILPGISDCDGDAKSIQSQACPEGDDDWFRIHIDDLPGCALAPQVFVIPPAGVVLEVTVNYHCDQTPASESVTQAVSEPTTLTVPVLGCGDLDASGVLEVRVRSLTAQESADYQLVLQG